MLPLCHEMAKRRWIVEGVDRLPQTLTFPITITLSGKSDQKLGSLVGCRRPSHFPTTMTLSGQSDQKAGVLGSEGVIFCGELAWILVLLLWSG